jgi:predicted nucleic acid-binding protein
MKRLIFDSGPIISLATNGLLWILPRMKDAFGGSFIITEAVRYELVTRPFETHRFKFEALQVERLIEQGVLELEDSPQIRDGAERLQRMANNVFVVHGRPLAIMHGGEAQALAAASALNADGIVMDERITRLLVERPEALEHLLGKRLHSTVHIERSQLGDFSSRLGKVRIIRSAELVTLAYEQGIFDDYKVRIPHVERELMDSLLWGMKLHGCGISEEEIAQLMDAVAH